MMRITKGTKSDRVNRLSSPAPLFQLSIHSMDQWMSKPLNKTSFIPWVTQWPALLREPIGSDTPVQLAGIAFETGLGNAYVYDYSPCIPGKIHIVHCYS